MTERLDCPGIDLVLELSEDNAPRRCSDSDCETDATYYVFTDDIASKFVCAEHLEGAIERAQA